MGEMYGYVCFCKGRRYEVQATTSYDAQKKAAVFFRVTKPHMITVVLAEKAGAPVVHSTAAL